MSEQNAVATTNQTPAAVMTEIIKTDFIQDQLKNACRGNENSFAASILDCYTGDQTLQRCNPKMVAIECLKAAILNLPLSRALGFAYVVVYGGKPTFTIGYKGLIQLAMRTGAYKCINAGAVYEGEFKGRNKLSGEVDISGERTSDEVVGYFCYIEMLNGFSKTLYMGKKEVEDHGKKFSKAYNNGPWKTNFDAMATKTVIRSLLSKYGMMTVEMQKAIVMENDAFDVEYRELANSQMLPMPEGAGPGETIDEQTGEVIEAKAVGADSAPVDAAPPFRIG